jgi:hypothetical protein
MGSMLVMELFVFAYCPHEMCLVGSPEGISPSGSHGSRRNSLPLPGSSHQAIQAIVSQRQCLNRFGALCTTALHQASAFFQDRKRRYFFRTHRRM